MEALGWTLRQQDFIQIHTLDCNPDPDFESASAWVFTSQHAVKAVAEILSPVSANKKVYCLEGATRAALKDLLPDVDVRATAPDGVTLAEKIILDKPGSTVFFCGRIRRDELPEKLKLAGIELKEVIVYDTILSPKLLSEMPDAILFFSPSAVQSFHQKNTIPPDAVCFAIGATTAASIRTNNAAAQIVLASEPNQKSILDALKNHYQTQSFESA